MTDRNSESNMPEGDFTWSTGSNHGLDGFYHDTSYDEGTAEGARAPGNEGIQHPQTGGYSHLPDGVVTSDGHQGCMIEAPEMVARHEDAFSLNAFIDEGDVYGDGSSLGDYLSQGGSLDSAVERILKEGAMDPGSLSDLTWLDPLQGQDPSRLPRDNYDALSELHDEWVANDPPRLATHFHAVPRDLVKDREAQAYFRSLDPEYQAPSNPHEERIASDRVKAVIQHAMRRSAYGEPMSVIALDALTLLGPLAPRAKRALEMVEAEHGLAGNVFIRAYAFPGLENGEWTDKLKKSASGARYILAAPGSTLARYPVYLGKEVVSEISWEHAYAHYAPRLKSAGHQVGRQGDPRELLRQSFLNAPQELTRRTAEGQPVFVPPSDLISLKEAQEAFANAPKEERIRLSPKEAQDKQARRKALLRIAHWVKGQTLSKEDGQRLASSGASPRAMLDTAAKLILASHRGHYLGEGEGALPAESEMSREAAWAELANARASSIETQAEVEASMRRKLEVSVVDWHEVGHITEDEARTLLAIDKPALEVMRIASALIRDTSRFRKKALPESERAKPYEGAQFHEPAYKVDAAPPLSEMDRQIMAAAKQARVRPGEITTMVRWARVQMTEGTIGKELDMLLGARFVSPVRQAAAPFLEQVRNEHEGVSGHIYVDAGAYASSEGVVGCDAGALQHRRNGLKFVLAMDRCGGCAFNKGGSCGKYKKALIDDIPVDDKVAYQVEAIRQANASDHEVTASLFSTNTFVPEEYNLGNDGLNDFDLNGSMDSGALGSVLWGDGFNIDF